LASKYYEIVEMLMEYGLKPRDIASSLYGVDWAKLDRKTRQRLINRVIALKHYASKKRFYDNDDGDFMTNEFYDNIDDSGGTRDRSQWSPGRDGTFNIIERKMYAANDYEKYYAEYERLLYYFYERTAYEYDDLSKTLWNRIIMVHHRIFREFWDKYHKKFSFNKQPRIPEVVAAYIYVCFFAAFYNYPGFYTIKAKLNKLIEIFVKDLEKYHALIKDLLPLIADFI